LKQISCKRDHSIRQFKGARSFFTQPVPVSIHVFLIILTVVVFFVPPDQKEEAERKLIKVAVDGTNNVLSSVTKVGKGTVKRVVITSSVAAIVNPLNPHAKVFQQFQM
jgi:nucleoside-diphosphate-sugar epimerase